MHVASILIILGSLAAGFGLPLLMGIVTLGHLLPGIFLGMYLTGIVSFFYISLMNVSIETIFICFCEDKLLNDGSPNKPYFMSPPLLALLTDAVKLAEEEREKREREDARRQDSESS
ncbi:hypothetical protein MTP99_013884 [Tenebrio molitor]|nr:hypothetical protein MTP99_013884 [Tenebrio molitor]